MFLSDVVSVSYKLDLSVANIFRHKKTLTAGGAASVCFYQTPGGGIEFGQASDMKLGRIRLMQFFNCRV